jgi:hypothetical protein
MRTSDVKKREENSRKSLALSSISMLDGILKFKSNKTDIGDRESILIFNWFR